VERHAYNTYKEFAEVNEQSLRQLPAPQIALDYYGTTDQYMFDAFQSSIVLSADPSSGPRRRPVIESLYDVFVAIRDDEAEHAATMEKLERDVALTSRGKQD
jgi:ubiquinol oxidase